MQRILHSRRAFVVLSRLMAPFIRRGLIRSSDASGALCVLRTRGRRTGKIREAALDYAVAADGGLLVAAGWGRETRWYLNVLADPRVEVTYEGRTRAGTATEVLGEAERLAGIRAVLAASGAVGRAFGYDASASDDLLVAEFAPIPIVHIALGR